MAERARSRSRFGVARRSSRATSANWDPRDLADLLDVSQALADSPSLRPALGRALDLLEERRRTVSSAVMLRDETTGELSIESCTGLGRDAIRRSLQEPPNGITARVVREGRPVVIPRVGGERLFLGPARAQAHRSEVSHVCVPVRTEAGVAGALGASLEPAATGDLGKEARFLEAVAEMLGKTLRLHRQADSERERLIHENRMLRQELADRHDVRNLVGDSRPMREVYQQIARIAPQDSAVLIRGEPGTGKEMIAHAIHQGSPRSGLPFVEVSCDSLAEGLIESRLFGREAGRKGRLELAHGGTLFVDRIGELRPSTQLKLLRLLREGEFERLGGIGPVRVDVRLIAATDRDLEPLVEGGAFRHDLYRQLEASCIDLPPLRARPADILLLLDHFVARYAAEHGRSVKRVGTTAVDAMVSHHWPGNVRELENCVERAVLACEGSVLHAHHLPPTLQTAESSGTVPGPSLAAAVAAVERDLLVDALKSARGSRARAARMLSATQRIVGYKIRKHGIDCERFKRPSPARR